MTRDGYGQAYQHGLDRTVRFLLSRGVRRDNARECAQDAWVKGWERLSQLRDEALVVTWVNTIALNAYRSLLRREPLNPVSPRLREKSVTIDLGSIDMARILKFCPPRDRILLEEYLKGATSAELAQQRGVSVTAIRLKLLRARRYTRGRIERTRVFSVRR